MSDQVSITEAFVLPADVVICAVKDLSPKVRDQLKSEEGDYAVTRPRSRASSTIVDAQAVELLEYFRTPTTIVEAVVGYSRRHKLDPKKTLDEAFPMVHRFIQLKILVPADGKRAAPITSSFQAGSKVGEWRVQRLIHLIEDTEVYQVVNSADRIAALKFLRPGSGEEVRKRFDREAEILKSLDGRVNPTLLEVGDFENQPLLVMEWCPGRNATTAAENARRFVFSEGPQRLLVLCQAIVDSYAHLHAQGVIHSDVYPQNVLVDPDGGVKIVDYGLARWVEKTGLDSSRKLRRGGFGPFFEPEYAQARLAGKRPPKSTMTGEQYSIAAMVYHLITGAYYTDFSVEKEEFWRQICEDDPLPFSMCGIEPWRELEEVLQKALSKNPLERYNSVQEFAEALKNVDSSRGSVAMRVPRGGEHSTAKELLNGLLENVDLTGTWLSSALTVSPICSVNHGAAGVAYWLYRLACVRSDPRLLSLADVWINKSISAMGSSSAFYSSERGLTEKVVGNISLYHNSSGVHCVQALISHAMGDMVSLQPAATAFVDASRADCENLDVTLGRCGTLIGCSLLLETMPVNPLLDTSPVTQLGNDVARGVWDELGSFPTITECYDFPFLGIAHGWAGVLYATMRWCQASNQEIPTTLRSRLEQLADCGEPHGSGIRWRRKIRREHQKHANEYMIGWCNGSAGFIYLWTLAHRLFADQRYLTLADRAARNSWEQADTLGNLCCGLAGQAYALLNFYKHTGDREWLVRAWKLADQAAVGVFPSDFSRSLYMGQLGVGLLAGELSRPQEACMPLFEAENAPNVIVQGS